MLRDVVEDRREDRLAQADPDSLEGEDPTGLLVGGDQDLILVEDQDRRRQLVQHRLQQDLMLLEFAHRIFEGPGPLADDTRQAFVARAHLRERIAQTEEDIDPRQQLTLVHRLEQVVVCARLEAAKPVRDVRSFTRDEQHGDVVGILPLAQPFAEFVPAHPREHYVEDEEVEDLPGLDQLHRRLGVRREADLVLPSREVPLCESQVVWEVVDDQDAGQSRVSGERCPKRSPGRGVPKGPHDSTLLAGTL